MPNKLTWGNGLLFSILLSSILLQSQCLLGHDMSWFMHATDRLLNGGTYTNNFFETNPPMALYIHIPPVLFSYLTHLSFITTFRLYIFFISFLSLILCARLLKSQIKPEHDLIYNILMICLAVCFMIVPGREFGQREHITIMLTMPYFLLQASNHPANRKIMIGLLAGIGFAIKPQFMFALILVEAYLMVLEKNIWRFLRLETILIASVSIIYLFSVFKLTPEYFEVIPFAQNWFAIYLKSWLAWYTLLSCDVLLFFLVTAILFFAFRKHLAYAKLSMILFLAATGFLLTYLAGHIYLWYHVLPLFVFSLLLFTLSFFDYTLIFAKSIMSKSIYIALTMFCFYVPVTYIFNVCLMMFLDSTVIEKMLIQTIKQHTASPAQGKQEIMFITTNPQLTYPLIDYANVKSDFRFYFLWPMITIVQHTLSPNKNKTVELNKQTHFIQHAIIADFVKSDPNLVLIDPVVGWILYPSVEVDYIKFLSESETFQQKWKNYRYLTNVGQIRVYKHI